MKVQKGAIRSSPSEKVRKRLERLHVERALEAALASNGSGAKTRRILEAVAHLRTPRPHFWEQVDHTPPDEVQRAAEDLSEWTAHLSPGVYQDIIETLKTHAQNQLASDGPPSPWIPGIVEFLCEEGDHFSIDELAAAFHKFSSPRGRSDDEEYFLSLIREKSVSQWREVIKEAFNTRSVSPRVLIDALTEHDEDSLLPQVQQRLEGGAFTPDQFHYLLSYYLEYTTLEEATSTLRRCYRIVNLRRWAQLLPEREENAFIGAFSREDVFRPLLHLMNKPDEEAWAEFRYRLDSDFVPLRRHHALAEVEIPTPQTIEHARILKDWYAQIRRSIDQTGDRHRDKKNFADSVLSRITDYGGIEVLRMLRKVQNEAPYEDAPWLSGTIMDLESQILSESAEQRDASKVLQMITTERYHDVQSENDLFEATREAIESLEENFRSGAGVAGFWNTGGSHAPKREEECQNTLWPWLAQHLDAYGVRGIEEEVVNENFADFRIDYPRASRSPLSVFIELKVARKGYGTSELVDPIEDQLYDEHLRPSGCNHGIFVVLWFKDSERYNHPTRWDDASALRRDVQERAAEVQFRYGVTISAYVLEMTAGYRSN